VAAAVIIEPVPRHCLECGPVDGDADLVTRLRAGDERAFVEVVDRYHTTLLRFALGFVPSAAVAEEVVQETWLAVVRGIDRFEGRSSLKTWLFRIVANRARTVGVRERRQSSEGHHPAVDPARFGGDGAWVVPPETWTDDVVERLVAGQEAERIKACLAGLPDGQRQVVLLRDVEGLSSREVCDVLGLSEVNQRVLLHRGRSRVRQALEPVGGAS
jgi:RNA polymerase sigma-70 factor (ECF subfamily)